jgi:hypothetical protein
VDRTARAVRVRALDPAEVADVIPVLPAATAARDALAEQGQALTRKALTEQLRTVGHPVSNARASVLVKILKADMATPDDNHEAEIIPMDPDSEPPEQVA